MRIGSLFSGIGGLELGLERAGCGHTVWQVERDGFCQKVLEKRWPSALRFDDVCTVGSHNLPPADLICGGFPCQDISYAGRGAGLAGARSGLWYEFARIVGEMGPRIVVVENVVALRRRGLSAVLGTLADLGYDAEWATVSASQFGAVHKRERTFIVAYNMRERGEGLEPLAYFGKARQGRWGRQEDLQQIFDGPFVPGPTWPTPLLRRMDDGVPSRMDRLKACGNAVVPDVAQWIGAWITHTFLRSASPGPHSALTTASLSTATSCPISTVKPSW